MERAVELDPKLAAGWSELALTHHLGTASRRAEGSEDAWDRAIECAERALALDPSLGEAHTVLGAVLLKRGEFSRAVRELEAGASVSPNAAWPVAMLASPQPRPAGGRARNDSTGLSAQPVGPGLVFRG
jgi:Flp pilus assembly protein TadD